MLFRLYIDESYQADHYNVVGIITTPNSDSELAHRLGNLSRDLREQYGFVGNPEMHAHELMNSRGPWEVLQNNPGQRISILRRGLIEVATTPLDIFIEGVDVQQPNARYRYPDPPYEVCLRHLLDRVEEKYGAPGNQIAVIADMIDRKDNFVNAISTYKRVGTSG